jgi:linoleoyl-CoA desaturase
MSQQVKFSPSVGSSFYATVRSRVDELFRTQQMSKNANVAMWAKTAFFLTGLLVIYLMIILNIFSPAVMLLLAVALGMFSAFVGFNICHDAIHKAFSSNNKVNQFFSFVFNLVGANPYVWSITHNIVHHTYTNIPGHDEDIEIAPGLIRIDKGDKILSVQRFQHWYAFPLYSMASLSWIFRKDFKKFFQHEIGSYKAKHPKKEYFNLFFLKGLYYFLYIVLPLLLLSVTWWQFLIGFVVLHIAQGLTMGLVFQLAHVVEGTSFPVPNMNGNIEEVWAEHQMRTTANFATHSQLAAFFLGGLNRQIEHHLFPKICHIHYGKISRIVKQTALEFNLPYIESKTFLEALRSHYVILKKYSLEARSVA